jgi:1-deoxy-D-xylulose-5-phosphate reductoisomerase
LISRIGIDSIDELTITASGGPFFNYSIEDLATVDADAAARHPVWKMGRKISIDSSTLANKGLELIEAARLFHMSEDSIQVLIHPQSLVHALVRSRDGSLFAHMSLPDMRLPIELALRWPMEASSNFPRLDLVGKSLSFFQPDEKKFPLIRLARAALRLGDSATIAYNAANEVAVEAFDKGLIRFLDIPRIVDSVLQSDWSASVEDFFSILDYDRKARSLSNKALLELIR